MKTILLSAALLAGASLPIAAQHSGHSMPSAAPMPSGMHGEGKGGGAMGAGKPAGGAKTTMPSDPASVAFAEANARMHKAMGTPSGSADVDFARGMVPHHQGAIDMAEIVLKYGKDTEVKTLASAIIKAQKSEIAQMQAWIDRNGKAEPGKAAPGKNAAIVIAAFNEANDAMHADMTMEPTGNADRDFMLGMIPHHEGAVEMAKIQLRYGADADMRKLAEDVVRSQSEEIVAMLGWLRRNGG